MGKFDATYRSIAAIPIAFYGYAFHKVFISTNGVPLSSISAATEPLLSSSITNTLAAFLLALFVMRIGTERIKKACFATGTICQLLSIGFSIAVALCSSSIETSGESTSTELVALITAATTAQSFGLVLLSALWVDLYAHLSPVRAIFCNAIAVVLAQTIVYFVELNPAPRLFLMLLLVTILTAIFYYLAAFAKTPVETNEDAAPAHSETKLPAERFLVPNKALAFIAVVSFAYGLAAPDTNVIEARYTAIIPSLVVIAIVLINSKKFDLLVLFRIALPLMVGGFLLVAVIPGASAFASSTLLYMGFSAMELLLFLMICTISYGTGTSAMWLFGLLGGTQFLARYLGILLASFAIQHADSTLYLVIVIATIVAIILVSFLVMSEKSLFLFWHVRSKKAGEADPDQATNREDYIRIRVNTLGSTHDLTDRELEVLYLLMQGKSNMQIGQDMFISEGTVKAHLHHIYRKFDIHNRKELQALVEGK